MYMTNVEEPPGIGLLVIQARICLGTKLQGLGFCLGYFVF